MQIIFPLPRNAFEGGAKLSCDVPYNLADILNQLAASIGFGSTKSIEAWNGSIVVKELIKKEHDPGLYSVKVAGTIRSQDGNGIIVYTIAFHQDPIDDQDDGNRIVDSPNIQNNNGTPLLEPFELTFYSDGKASIAIQFASMGSYPTGGVNLYFSGARVG